MGAVAAPRSRRAAVPWIWAGIGIVLGLVSVALVAAPAQWMGYALQTGLQERAFLDDARGTLWSGSASLRLSGGAGSNAQTLLPGRLNWRVQPTAQGLQIDLLADCCMDTPWRWQVQPHWAGLRLEAANARTQWPAPWLAGLGTPWNTLQPEGQLLLHTESLVVDWTQGRLSLGGKVQLDALNMASRLSTIKPLGSYRFTLQGGASPSLLLSTLEGALQLQGTGVWVGSRLRFEGEARASAAQLEALSNLLNIIGRREGERSIIKLG